MWWETITFYVSFYKNEWNTRKRQEKKRLKGRKKTPDIMQVVENKPQKKKSDTITCLSEIQCINFPTE